MVPNIFFGFSKAVTFSYFMWSRLHIMMDGMIYGSIQCELKALVISTGLQALASPKSNDHTSFTDDEPTLNNGLKPLRWPKLGALYIGFFNENWFQQLLQIEIYNSC